jgi:transposase
MIPSRNLYPTDVSNEEWAFVAPYLILLPEGAGQRTHSLREVFNGLRWIVRAGAPWRMMPNDLPPRWVVYQQTQRWVAAGCFTALVDDLRLLLREAKGRNRQPSAAIWIVEPCNRPRKVEVMQVMMEPSVAKGAKCMLPLTRWAIC